MSKLCLSRLWYGKEVKLSEAVDRYFDNSVPVVCYKNVKCCTNTQCIEIKVPVVFVYSYLCMCIFVFLYFPLFGTNAQQCVEIKVPVVRETSGDDWSTRLTFA